MTGHTATPWVATPYLSPKGKAFIKTLDRETITSGPILSDANAALIVRAVNAHATHEKIARALSELRLEFSRGNTARVAEIFNTTPELFDELNRIEGHIS